MSNLKSIKKFGSEEAYQRELAKQRTREYKDKRNGRVKRKKLRDRFKALIVEEAEIKVRLKENELLQKKILNELAK